MNLKKSLFGLACLSATFMMLTACKNKKNNSTTGKGTTQNVTTKSGSSTTSKKETTKKVTTKKQTTQAQTTAQVDKKKESFDKLFGIAGFEDLSKANYTLTNERIVKKVMGNNILVSGSESNPYSGEFTYDSYYNFIDDSDEEGAYYIIYNLYRTGNDNFTQAPGGYTSDFNGIVCEYFLPSLKYSDFTFDEETNTYKTTKTISYTYSELPYNCDFTMSGIEIRFENDNVVSIKYEINGTRTDWFDEETETYTESFSYTISNIGTTTFDIPEYNDPYVK